MLAAKAPAQDAETSSATVFDVQSYVLEGSPLLPSARVASTCSPYTGPEVNLAEIVKAASDLQLEYHREGYPPVSIAFSREEITNGIVTFNVFQAAIPQVMVSGERWLTVSNGVATVAVSSSEAAPPPAAVTNAAPHVAAAPPKPATQAEIARAYAQLLKEMSEPLQPPDTRVHVPPSSGPKFDVERYRILGNTILSPDQLAEVLTNIDGAYGTNVSFAGVKTVVEQLEQAYHERGYVTVAVDVPRQTLANQTVKLDVLEGQLAGIDVEGNHYFSSNNVMRALPSLHTNMVLNSYIFNSEIARANANQDRQIYPVIGPGPSPGTSQLTLSVKDRLPLHSKLEFNNESSPGTPDLRVNGSAVYDNLWQDENALGVDYGFSPEKYKQEIQWPFYDAPDVDYYSAFYRFPLGSPSSVEEMVAKNPNFGYSEATHQFRVPTGTSQPELTFYANRAVIDTGVKNGSPTTLVSTNTTSLTKQPLNQDITINEDIGFQLSKPLPEMNGIRSMLSGGLDFKVYSLNLYGTNVYSATEVLSNNTVTAEDVVLQGNTQSRLAYLPISLNYSGSFQDIFGPASFGLSLSANLWYSASYEDEFPNPSSTNASLTLTSSHGRSALANIVNSAESYGHWVVLRPSFSQQFQFYTNWITTVRLDGQWASEPLVSIEQFGAGGVNSVPGYHEGEVFGDNGWHWGIEQDTAPLDVGDVGDGSPLTVRGSVFIDYARVYLIDPPSGSPASTSLCGAGFGVNTAIGSHWQAQFMCSWPLLTAGTVSAYQPFFNFDLTAQF